MRINKTRIIMRIHQHDVSPTNIFLWSHHNTAPDVVKALHFIADTDNMNQAVNLYVNSNYQTSTEI